MDNKQQINNALDALVARGSNIKDMKASEFMVLWDLAKDIPITSRSCVLVLEEYNRRVRGD